MTEVKHNDSYPYITLLKRWKARLNVGIPESLVNGITGESGLIKSTSPSSNSYIAIYYPAEIR